MPRSRLHRFQRDGRRFAIDVQTCFCFECDDITWDLLEHYPHEPANRIYHLLGEKHDRAVLAEVIGELEWLRSTNSILPPVRRADDEKWLRLERGLRSLSVDLRGEAGAARENIGIAVELLAGRSLQQQEPGLTLLLDADPDGGGALDAVRRAQACAARVGALSGKSIRVSVRLCDVRINTGGEASPPHRFSLELPLAGEGWEKRLSELTKVVRRPDKPAACARVLSEDESARVILHVGDWTFPEYVKALHGAGFRFIEVDLDRSFADSATFVDLSGAYAEMAAFYVGRLLEHDYFRLEPLAGSFQHIHQGRGVPRRDDSGTYALHVAADGSIFPGEAFSSHAEFRSGSMTDGTLDESKLAVFDDVGSTTTSACRRCWAANVCGGGSAAVHLSLSGSIRAPHDAWCDMQRRCIESAVGAFNDVASAGIPFDRVHAQMGKQAAPSLFQMARAAFRSDIGLRPLAESDADLLRDWESWNRSAYFLLNERNIFIGNSYEREVDATQPKPGEFEMMVIRKGGAAAGLLRVRMTREPGVAEMFLYFHDESAYRSGGVARSFRGLITDAAAGQSITRIVTPVAPWESGLSGFLGKCGFTEAGLSREALFTRGHYHDVHLMTIAAEFL